VPGTEGVSDGSWIECTGADEATERFKEIVMQSDEGESVEPENKNWKEVKAQGVKLKAERHVRCKGSRLG
jgi:hypothetical protein